MEERPGTVEGIYPISGNYEKEIRKWPDSKELRCRIGFGNWDGGYRRRAQGSYGVYCRRRSLAEGKGTALVAFMEALFMGYTYNVR